MSMSTTGAKRRQSILIWRHWFCGLCDGEASFTFRNDYKMRRARPRFQVLLQGNHKLLEQIASTLGLGRVNGPFIPKSKRGGIQPYLARSEIKVSRRERLQSVIAFFSRYPLRSSKMHDFEIWKTLVNEYCAAKPDWLKVNRLALRLTEETERNKGQAKRARTALRLWLK